MCLSGSDPKGRKYCDESLSNCIAMDLKPTLLNTPAEVKAIFPAGLATGAFGDRVGYANKTGGWGEAARAIEIGHKRILAKGGVIRGGAEVVEFKKTGKKVTGVVLKSGEVVPADLVLVAAGAWTPALLASPAVNAHMPPVVATGQVVCMIQLTPEEYKIQSQCPVVFNLDNGFYIFPPTKDGIVKMAIHAAGYTNSKAPSASGKGVSVPRTKLTPGTEGTGAIPADAVRAIRAFLKDTYPELAKKPFVDTRMCWYCDTVSGDWLIDYHPEYENLVLATGGSGHAFKFAPNIGREVLKIIEREPGNIFADRFSFVPTKPAGADVRNGTLKEIVDSELHTLTDLLPVPGRAGARL
jgi:sarcosine oxidase/L-pipecolate oxidase